jgi:hypothetical protein
MPSAALTRTHLGVDGQDFGDIEVYGVQRWLGELALALRQETYRRITAHSSQTPRCFNMTVR